jgi:hypothetical protein
MPALQAGIRVFRDGAEPVVGKKELQLA